MHTQRTFPLTGQEQKQVMDGAISHLDSKAFKDALMGALNLYIQQRGKIPMLLYENEEGTLRFTITFAEHKDSKTYHIPDNLIVAVRENHYELEFINKTLDKFIKSLKQGVPTP